MGSSVASCAWVRERCCSQSTGRGPDLDRLPLPHRLDRRGVPGARSRPVSRQHDPAEHGDAQPAAPGQSGHQGEPHRAGKERRCCPASSMRSAGFTAAVEPYAVSENGSTATRSRSSPRRGSTVRCASRCLRRSRRPARRSRPTSSCSRPTSTPLRTPSSVRWRPRSRFQVTPLPSGNGASQVSAELADVLLVRPGHHAASAVAGRPRR